MLNEACCEWLIINIDNEVLKKGLNYEFTLNDMRSFFEDPGEYTREKIKEIIKTNYLNLWEEYPWADWIYSSTNKKNAINECVIFALNHLKENKLKDEYKLYYEILEKVVLK